MLQYSSRCHGSSLSNIDIKLNAEKQLKEYKEIWNYIVRALRKMKDALSDAKIGWCDNLALIPARRVYDLIFIVFIKVVTDEDDENIQVDDVMPVVDSEILVENEDDATVDSEIENEDDANENIGSSTGSMIPFDKLVADFRKNADNTASSFRKKYASCFRYRVPQCLRT